MTRAPASSLHTRLSDAVEVLSRLIARMEAEVPEKRRNPYGGFGSGKGGHGSLASWNPQAAMWVLDVHQGVREIEQDLRYQAARRLRPLRGGSDQNTLKVIAGLPALAAGCDYAGAMAAARRLESWVFRGRLILGDVEPFARLPRLPGERAPSCPYCRSDTLRYRPITGKVSCVRPGCTDSNGDPPRGDLTTGTYSGEPMLAWRDGSSGAA